MYVRGYLGLLFAGLAGGFVIFQEVNGWGEFPTFNRADIVDSGARLRGTGYPKDVPGYTHSYQDHVPATVSQRIETEISRLFPAGNPDKENLYSYINEHYGQKEILDAPISPITLVALLTLIGNEESVETNAARAILYKHIDLSKMPSFQYTLTSMSADISRAFMDSEGFDQDIRGLVPNNKEEFTNLITQYVELASSALGIDVADLNIYEEAGSDVAAYYSFEDGRHKLSFNFAALKNHSFPRLLSFIAHEVIHHKFHAIDGKNINDYMLMFYVSHKMEHYISIAESQHMYNAIKTQLGLGNNTRAATESYQFYFMNPAEKIAYWVQNKVMEITGSATPFETYIVRAGDNLSTIIRDRYHISDWDDVVRRANIIVMHNDNLQSRDRLRENMIIQLPSPKEMDRLLAELGDKVLLDRADGEVYTVKSGDGPASIVMQHYSISYAAAARWLDVLVCINPRSMPNENTVRLGEQILLPSVHTMARLDEMLAANDSCVNIEPVELAR